jgi:hypothetical protein
MCSSAIALSHKISEKSEACMGGFGSDRYSYSSTPSWRARTASTSPRFAAAACSSLACIRWHGRVGASPLARSALSPGRMECAYFIGSRVQRASGRASTSSWPSATRRPGLAATDNGSHV